MSSSTDAKEMEPLIARVDEEAALHAIEAVEEPLMGFVYFGFVGNLCFNFLLQEVAFFNAILGDSFGVLAGMIYAFANNLGQILIVWKGSSISFAWRIGVSSSLLGLILIFIPLLTVYEIPFRLSLALVLVACMGFMVAVLASAGYGLTGVCSSQVRIFYTVGASLPGLLALPIMIGFDFIFARVFNFSSERGEGGTMPSQVDTATTFGLLSISAVCMFVAVPHYLFSLGRSKTVLAALERVEGTTRPAASQTKLQIFTSTLPLALAVWNLMMVTFVVLPDQMIAWKTNHPNWYPGKEFGYQNINIYVFQIFDTVGRFLVAAGVSFGPISVMVASGLRILLIPFFFLATARISFFDNDFFKFALNAVFATSYGILLTLGMIQGSQQVRPDNADTAGYIMSFFLSNGIIFGAFIALGIQKIPLRYFQHKTYSGECRISENMQLICVENLQTTLTPN